LYTLGFFCCIFNGQNKMKDKEITALETSFYNFSTGIAQFMWKNKRRPMEGCIS